MKNLNSIKLILLIALIIIFQSGNASIACRMVAIQGDGNAELIQELLVYGQNSLASQSKPDRETIIEHYKGMNPAKIFSRHYKPRLKEGNLDGWGIVAYNKKSVKTCGMQAAYKSKAFEYYTKKLSQKHPKILLSHIRSATEKNTIKRKNLHPFRYHHWSFMHNGFLTNTNIKEVAKYKVDSEKAFRFILSRISHKCKCNPQSLTISHIGEENFKRIFLDSIKILIQKSQKPYVANFVITDGQQIYAYKDGSELFIGHFKGNTILASEIIQPQKSKNKIKWANIPDKKVIVISK